MDRAKKISKKSKKQHLEDFKVVYISSPVKVKTCASKFKNLVQELTGRHSDISRFVETNDDNDVDDHKQYLSVVDLLDDNQIQDNSTSMASSESNYEQPQNMDEQSRQVMTSCYHHHDDQIFHGLISPFDLVDRSSTENHYYIPTF